MAEDKQYEPTQSRLERARREGDVARSQELVSLAGFAAGAIVLSFGIDPLAGALSASLTGAFRRQSVWPSVSIVSMLALLPCAVAALASSACAFCQQGGLRIMSIAPKFDRLSPSENLKRIISREAAVAALRSSIAFVCTTGVIVMATRAGNTMFLPGRTLETTAAASWNDSLSATAAACGVASIFAVADYALQVQRWRRRLRMSPDEMRRDRKEQEGDPIARSRRKALRRQIARGGVQRVKDASFVVCNPQHIAVAVEYRPPAIPVPRVLVRAADETAARVREIAANYRIPLVRNVAVAHLLYDGAQVDEFIPPESYLAVAEIVAALQTARPPA